MSAAPGERPSPSAAEGRPEAPSSRRRMDPRALRAAFYRQALFAAGVVFLVIGAIGMVVPMLPGTVFLILAAWCFTRSSPRFEAWLLNHRYLGPSVARWRETGAIPPVAKLFALSSFVGTFGGSWYFGAPQGVLIFLGLLFAALAAFIITRPNG
ncbi:MULTISPECIES: YbaN family protein [unclassified Xanthobacter]|uniref:YbaN family protein n=1 Tax=unclassified Xanthobacter TaxID=2623496 RepID=UPI001EDE6E5F|nr:MULTISPECIES: YbaN family protein [unclassified Xanthobacter]